MELKVESKTGTNNCMDSQLFNFLSDMQNIAMLVPPEHKSKAQFTRDSCTLNVPGSSDITLKVVEREPNKLIKLQTDADKKDFIVWIQLKQVASYDTKIKVTVKTDVNIIEKMIYKGYMQKFADGVVDGLSSLPPHVLHVVTNAN